MLKLTALGINVAALSYIASFYMNDLAPMLEEAITIIQALPLK